MQQNSSGLKAIYFRLLKEHTDNPLLFFITLSFPFFMIFVSFWMVVPCALFLVGIYLGVISRTFNFSDEYEQYKVYFNGFMVCSMCFPVMSILIAFPAISDQAVPGLAVLGMAAVVLLYCYLCVFGAKNRPTPLQRFQAYVNKRNDEINNDGD